MPWKYAHPIVSYGILFLFIRFLPFNKTMQGPNNNNTGKFVIIKGIEQKNNS